jgi:tetratricopeptide (TPR) repeat protein
LERFEDAWQRGERPVLEDYLKGVREQAERCALLMELVHEDLEYRLKAGEAMRVERYLERYPELASDLRLLSGLLVAEHQLRQGRGEKMELDEYLRRFPQLGEDLRAHLKAPADGRTDTVLDSPPSQMPSRGEKAAGLDADPVATNWPRIPGYQVLGKLGEGGMGVVYKAQQVQLKRLVALKMIRAGAWADAEDVARFRREAEAVARLQHPHIVQIYEVGETAGGPYFSLEYLPGGSLAQKIAGTPQPARPAAELVATLARAVHTAHQCGIVHRDLKPANVLLTDDGVPKITDFGLSKRLDGDPSQTPSEALMGTPSYMAPEQARRMTKVIGPAVDIYALGAILYELLTGRPPFKAETLWDTVAQVVHEEPVPPRRLQPRAPHDLETICLRCLQKEPRKRYASAEDLADDLRRFLANLPIEARSIGPWEKGWKWARRHPAGAALLAVSFVALVSFVGGGIWHVMRMDKALQEARAARADADRERQIAEEHQKRAERTAQEAGAVADFLAGLFQTADPTGVRSYGFRSGGHKAGALNARQILDRGAEGVRAQLKNQPAVQAAMLDILGNVYRSLGELERAGPLLREGLKIRQNRFGSEHLEIAKSLFHLAWLQQDLGEYQEAERLYREALRMRQKFLGNDDLPVADTMFNLAWVLVHRLPELQPSSERLAESEKLFREVLRIRRATLGKKHRDVAFVLTALAALLFGRGGADLEAGSLLVEAAQIFQEADETIPTGNVLVTYFRGERARKAGRLDEAVQLQRQVLESVRAYLGGQHPLTALALGNLAGLLRKQGDLASAEKMIREALAIVRPSPLRWHPMTIEALNRLADHVQDRENPVLAASTVGLLGSPLGKGPFVAASALVPGRCEAEMLYREAFTIAQRRLARDHPLFRQTLNKLTALLRKQGRQKEADALTRAAM